MVLKRAIEHNKTTYRCLSELLQKAVDQCLKSFSKVDDFLIGDIRKSILRDIYYSEDDMLVLFNYFNGKENIGIVTNVVRCNATPKKPYEKDLVSELNSIYSDIMKLMGDN